MVKDAKISFLTIRDILYSPYSLSQQIWSYPEAVNEGAAGNGSTEGSPVIGVDSEGNWIALWSTDRYSNNEVVSSIYLEDQVQYPK